MIENAEKMFRWNWEMFYGRWDHLETKRQRRLVKRGWLRLKAILFESISQASAEQDWWTAKWWVYVVSRKRVDCEHHYQFFDELFTLAYPSPTITDEVVNTGEFKVSKEMKWSFKEPYKEKEIVEAIKCLFLKSPKPNGMPQIFCNKF